MRDLEIRGAGNLLGAEQSGHIMEVGFNLYCELLNQAVREIKGIKEITLKEVDIDLKIEAYIPDDYVTDERQRIALYRRLNVLSEAKQVKEIKEELVDRFGKLPIPLVKLIELIFLRVKALKAGIARIREDDKYIYLEKVTGKVKKIKTEGKDKLKLISQVIG